MKTALLALILLATATPVLADDPDPQVTCATVRAYVTQVGLVQARAQARAAGMTAAQQRRARQCLASKD
jgi:hypothetical protein